MSTFSQVFSTKNFNWTKTNRWWYCSKPNIIIGHTQPREHLITNTMLTLPTSAINSTNATSLKVTTSTNDHHHTSRQSFICFLFLPLNNNHMPYVYFLLIKIGPHSMLIPQEWMSTILMNHPHENEHLIPTQKIKR